MRHSITFALALVLASPTLAQEITSTSGSDASSVSGSQSGAISDQAQNQANTQNGNIGTSRNENNSQSASDSVSVSGSTSGSVSDQTQGQSQGLSNTTTTSLGQTQGQQAVNQQGVTFNQTTNAYQRKTTEVKTNNAIPLAASSSFSSDYCGGTASGGASAAPLGISIGGAAPVFDKSCQSLRRAEKFGMIAANYQNLGQPEMALKAMSLMVWSVCTADSQGPKGDRSTALACYELALLGQGAMKPQDPSIPSVATPPEHKGPYSQKQDGSPTAEAVSKAATDQRSQKLSLVAVGK